MKWLITAALFLFLLQFGFARANPPAQTISEQSFYELTAQAVDGRFIKMADYKGKLLLIVNVASKCGYTPQYKGLEEIYAKNIDKGFVVLGFPSNDFGAQEPGQNEDIQKFCKLNYSVSFPLFSKNPVTGAAKQSVYKFLTERAPVKGEVGWNFEKFLVAPNGKIVKRWKSAVEPESQEIAKAIAEFLPGSTSK